MPGNAGGPGNPFARRVAALRKVLLDAVSDADLQIVAEQLVVKAKMGDLVATKLLFQYVLGKPAATVDPDSLDVEEFELYKRAPAHREISEILGGRLWAQMTAEVLRYAVPCAAANVFEPLCEGLQDPEAFRRKLAELDGLDVEEDEGDEDEMEEAQEEEGAAGPAPAATGQPAGHDKPVASIKATVSGNGRRSETRPSINGEFPRARVQDGTLGKDDNKGSSSPVQSRKRRGTPGM
jgi:hypothetical protein